MRFSILASALSSSCCAASLAPQLPVSRWSQDAESSASDAFLFANPPPSLATDHRIPTSYESAVMARRILALTSLGTLTTVYPSDGHGVDDPAGAQENRPAGLGGIPVGLMEYVADCEGAGNPTLLAVQIATPFKNYRAGSNISLALQWTPPHPPARRIRSAPGGLLGRAARFLGLGGDGADGADGGPPYQIPYSAANLPRFALLGYLEDIDGWAGGVAECFLASHPDARLWLPGNGFHKTRFVRLVVTQVYWMGGFGDRAYLGWIPLDEWRNVTTEEWERIRLPGEKKGWKEWDVGSWSEDDL